MARTSRGWWIILDETKQELTACEIELAVTEWLLKRGHASVITHFYPCWWHECDVYSVTKAGYGIEIEAKISLADFCADFKKGRKHTALAAAMRADCPIGFAIGVPRQYYFAVPERLINSKDIPNYAGLLYVYWREATPVKKEGYEVFIEKGAPVLRAAKKVTADQLQKLDAAYKFHYYTLLRQLTKIQRERKG